MVPDTLKFLIAMAAVAGAIFGSAWTLAHFPPQQTAITKSLSDERLK